MKILLVYGTTEGHTRRVAAFIADRLSGRGHEVTLAQAAAPGAGPDTGRCDAVLIAASVHLGRYQRAVIDFVRQHRTAIDARPNALVSVSLSAAGHADDDVQGLSRCVARFTADTGWAPRRVVHVAGALRYTAYDLLTRWVMRTIAWRKGAPTDTRRDHELTDWDALARFADAFAQAADARD